MKQKSDWFFVIILSLMAVSAALSDTVPAFDIPMSEDSPSAWGRFVYNNYAKGVDPFYAANPFFNQAAAFLSVFFFAPIYIYLAIGFYRGNANIRVPALMFSGALILAMIMHMGFEFFHPNPELRVANLGKYLMYSSLYILMPFLIVFRLRKGF